MNNLETAVRRAAPVVALVITSTVLLAELAFRLGYLLGSAIHNRNDQLAAVMVRLTARSVAAVERPLREPAPTAPAVHPLAIVAAGLEPLSHRQLQVITGSRRRVAKQQLIAEALLLA